MQTPKIVIAGQEIQLHEDGNNGKSNIFKYECVLPNGVKAYGKVYVPMASEVRSVSPAVEAKRQEETQATYDSSKERVNKSRRNSVASSSDGGTNAVMEGLAKLMKIVGEQGAALAELQAKKA